MQLTRSLLLGLLWCGAPVATAADWGWSDDPVPTAFAVHEASLPGEGWHDALTRAARAWNVDGAAAVTLRVDPPTTSPGDEAGDDDRHTIDGGHGDVGALTVFTRVEGDDLVACDLRVHTTNDDGALAWSTATPPDNATYDAERALVHGLGRCLGLPESDDPTSTMYPPSPTDAASLRAPSPDDVAALQARYGLPQVALERYTQAVLYDVDDREAGDGRASPGEEVWYRVELINTGDAAWGLQLEATFTESTADLTWIDGAAEVGDIDRGALADAILVFRVEDCLPNVNPTTARLDLTDARGDVHEVSVSFPLQCADPDGPGGRPGEGDGCGCATPPRAPMWISVFVLALASARRRLG